MEDHHETVFKPFILYFLYHVGIWYLPSYSVIWVEPTGSLKLPKMVSILIIIVWPSLLVRVENYRKSSPSCHRIWNMNSVLNFLFLPSSSPLLPSPLRLSFYPPFLPSIFIFLHGFRLPFLVNIGIQDLQLSESVIILRKSNWTNLAIQWLRILLVRCS